MVCAPTNKAVTVLCSRFLKAFDDESYPCNVVLVGDEDKLLENEIWTRGNVNAENSKLRENFLYTFIDAIKDEFLYVRSILDKGNFRRFNMIQKMVRRLKNLMMQKVTDKKVVQTADKIERMIKDFSKARVKSYPREIIVKIDLILGMIGAWDRDIIWQQMLRSADVVFCTLGSSGSLFLKKFVGEIDDLIVDEAAAATEPEIYIPFQYLPRRLLCVGDPKQLPATITSQFAEHMGLSKSLHERLMYDCNHGHIMLDTQYRMNPALSQFPSNNFYRGRLKNGKNVLADKKLSMMSHSVYTLYQIDGKERQHPSGSIENEEEANAVVQIVENLRQASHGPSLGWCTSNRLRIITFYQAQVSLIKRLLYRRNLGNVLVSTVDSSQGSEADFVIISFVRSYGEAGKKTVGFVADDRRLNVALTRAKHQMICVGNIERLASLSDGKSGSVKHLAIDALNRLCVQPFPFKNRSSSRTTDCANSHNAMGRKRKPEPLGRNRHEGGSPDKAARRSFGANTPGSNSESDDSSVVSSSSSDSDSSTSSLESNAPPSTSNQPPKSEAGATITDDNLLANQGKKSFIESDLPVSSATRQNPSSETGKSAEGERTNITTGAALSTSYQLPKSKASATIADKNLPTYEGKKCSVEPDLPVSLATRQNPSIENEKPAEGGERTNITSTSENREVTVSDERSQSLDEPQSIPQSPVGFRQMQPSILSKAETIAVFEDFSF